MEYFKFLPEEITINILTRLPTESVLDCKLVCTNWRNLVGRHPWFSKMHLHHLNHPFAADSGKLGFIVLTKLGRGFEKLHYFEYDEEIHDRSTMLPVQRIRRIKFTPPLDNATTVVGSCRGLLCLTRYFFLAPQSICICNPVTREYVVLPEVKTDCDAKDVVFWTSGFGYVSSTNEYKVVGIYILGRIQVVEIHIYTLGSGNGWRNLGRFNCRISRPPFTHGMFANGALYWMGVNFKKIITFDLAEEKLCQFLSPPPLPQDGNLVKNRIGVLDDGCLFFAVYLVVEGAQCYDVWLLKQKNDDRGMKEGEEYKSLAWSKEFRIDGSKLFSVTKTGGVLTYIDNYLNFYDTKDSTLRRLVDFEERIWEVIPYKITLVSLKELGEEDTKIME